MKKPPEGGFLCDEVTSLAQRATHGVDSKLVLLVSADASRVL